MQQYKQDKTKWERECTTDSIKVIWGEERRLTFLCSPLLSDTFICDQVLLKSMVMQLPVRTVVLLCSKLQRNWCGSMVIMT